MPRVSARHIWTVVALLWLAGVGLRLTVLAVPPVIAHIQKDLDLSGTQIGILSGLPVILFALAALPGSLLIARVGAVRTLVIGLVVAGIASGLRGAWPGLAPLYAGTILMGAGIAVMQPALPAIVRQWLPARIGFGTAIYTNGLLVSEVLPVAFTLPLVFPLVADSWRGSLAFWGAPLIAVAALVLLFAPPPAAPMEKRSGPVHWWPDWRDSSIWRLGFILSSVNSVYFGVNTFLPGHLTQAGRPDLISAALTAINLTQIPASFLLLAIAHRVERRAWPFMICALAMLVGVVGIALTASLWTVAFAGFLGVVGAVSLSLGLTLPAVLSKPADVPRTAAAMFTVSYTGAMAYSVVSGAAWDLTGDARFAFLPLAISVLPQLLLIRTIRFERLPA